MVQVVVNPCVGVVIMLVGMYAAMKFWPKFINGTLGKQKGKTIGSKFSAIFLERKILDGFSPKVVLVIIFCSNKYS